MSIVITYSAFAILHSTAALMAFQSPAALVFNTCAAAANILLVMYYLTTPTRPDELSKR